MQNTEAHHIREQIAALVDKYAALTLAPQLFFPGVTSIPPSGKVLGAEELKNMVDASLDGWLTTGRFNASFESKLASFIGIKHLITVNSGSSANLVAFNTLTSPLLGDRAIKKGDEVIGVAAGFPTTVNPIIQFGAVPVFVDRFLRTDIYEQISVIPLDLVPSLCDGPGRLLVDRWMCRRADRSRFADGRWFVASPCDE